MKLAIKATAALLLTFPAVTISAPHEDKYLLTETVSAGDVVMVKDNLHVDVKVNASGPDLPAPINKVEVHNELQEYKETVVAADAKGPSNVLRFYTVAREVNQEDGKDTKEIKPYEGKSVRIVRDAKGTHFTMSGGALEKKFEDALSSAVEKKLNSLYPTTPIAVGDKWKPDMEKALGSNDAPFKTADATFVEVAPHAGMRCAHIHIEAPLDADQGGLKMGGKLVGELYYGLDVKRTVSLTMEGPLTMEGKQAGAKGDIQMKGEGKIKASLTMDIKQLAGKPVPPAAP